MVINYNIANKVNCKLLNWFEENKRDLVFRLDRDPYKVWISEIMAQQTQINTLLPYFNRFIERFPDIDTLARADVDEVLSLWEGLGYYSRAKNIHKTAKQLKGQSFPNTYKSILTLPGIGPYTAGAIASICFNEKVPAIDGNVIRVISRIYEFDEDLNQTKLKNELHKELTETMPDEAGKYNESLMELGALICLPKNPKCMICPVREYCLAYKNGTTERLPVKKKKIKKTIEPKEAVILVDTDNSPLYIKRTEETLLNNLDGFPIFDQTETSGEKVREFLKDIDHSDLKYIGQTKHTFTHKQWITDVYTAKIKQDVPSLTSRPASIPTAFKKMLDLLD